MKQAVAYCRFSSSNQREESIDAQLRAINAYCDHNHYRLIGQYFDMAKTGTDDDRPQFQRLFKDIKSGMECDAVIVHKLDRFARDRRISAIYKHELRTRGIRLLSVVENLDDSPESIILESVIEGMSEYYSQNLAREIKKGKTETALQGKHNGGKPPLGYDINEDRQYIINEVEAEAVRLIYTMYSQDKSYSEIMDYLNSHSYKTKPGRPFTKNSFHELLRNEKYKGTLIHGMTQSSFSGKRNSHRKKPREEMIIIEDGCPAIVDKELWEKVNKKMDGNKRQGAKKARQNYLLSGLIYCGECGSPMSGNSKTRDGKDYSDYICNKRKREKNCTAKGVNKVKVEQMVIDHLQNDFFSPGGIETVVVALRDKMAEINKRAATAVPQTKAKLREHEIALESIVKDIETGNGKDWMYDRGDYHHEQIQHYKAVLESYEKKEYASTLTDAQIRKYLMKDADIKTRTPDEQKVIIQSYVEKVVIYNDSVDVHLCVDIDGAPGGT